MYVRDIMTKHPVTASPDDSAEYVAKLVAERHVNNVFVVEHGTPRGLIAQTDLLQHIFPSHQEFYDDLIHNIDFEEIAHRTRELAFLKARDIMSPLSLTLPPETPVMKAAAWMLLRDLSCVAIVDKSKQLLGVVSRGDVFYHVVNRELRSHEPLREHVM